MSYHVKLWGVRGSLPSPYTPEELEQRIRHLFESFFEQGFTKASDLDTFLAEMPIDKVSGYGGNTTCIEVFDDADRLVIDGGSGLRSLNAMFLRPPYVNGEKPIELLFTHFHWDHLIGLPFFVPVFVPGVRINMYAVQDDLEANIRNIFRKPNFPVPFEDLGANFSFHSLKPREVKRICGFDLTPYQLDHPDPCWGFKIRKYGRTYSHCVDTECTRVTREELGPDLPLYQNVDLMVFDGQYTIMEATERVNWGHAAAALGLDIAVREGIQRVVFMHHDPAAPDNKVADAEKQTLDYYNLLLDSADKSGSAVHPVDWGFAIEGATYKV